MKTKYTWALLPFLASCGGTEEPVENNENTDTVVATVVTYDQIISANWLLGTWENREENYVASENWQQLDDSTFTGTGLSLAGGDTVNFEQIRIEERNGQLYYIPTVQGQNDGQPVQFTATSVTDTELVFENPGHDFPQKIAYTKITADSIVAVISGVYESQETSQPYPMKRVQ
jgi:hypothetical protein